MTNLINSANILVAFTKLENELPNLVDPANLKNINKILLQINSIADTEVKDNLAYKLLDLIESNPEARDRVSKELQAILDLNNKDILIHELQSYKKYFASKLGITSECIDSIFNNIVPAISLVSSTSSIGDNEKVVIIPPGGKEGATSVKFKNIFFEFDKLIEIAASVIIAGFEIVGQPNPFFISATVLLIICQTKKASTIEITEQEASVYWGLINLTNKKQGKIAKESDITRIVNEEREKWGFKCSLLDDEIRVSLEKLSQIKAIEAISEQAGVWRLIERFRIAD